MAYSDTPLANQRITDSQPLIRANFSQIESSWDVNHVDFGSSDNGKHAFITFPNQASAPNPPFLSTELSLFNQNAAPTNVQDLWFGRGTATPYPITGFDQSGTSGWTYIPSGMLMIWGTYTITTGNALTAIVFNNATSGGITTFPGFSTFIATIQTNVMVSVGPTAVANSSIILYSLATTGFTCFPSQLGNNIEFTWLAWGL